MQELQQLDTREFTKYLNSTERRAVLRQFDVIEKFVTKCKKRQDKKMQIRTQTRHLVVVPKMVDFTIYIYSGKEYVPIKIMPEMIGHRLGEFVPTRRKVEHGAPGIGATRSSAALSVK